MAISKRYLNLFGIAIAVLVSGRVVFAQQPEEQPVLFRVISAGNTVTNLFYDLTPGKRVAVNASSSSLSSPYTCPATGLISFYREIPSDKPGEPPHKVAITEARLGKGGPYLIMLSYLEGGSNPLKMDSRVIDDSWVAHPNETLRVFNLSKRRAALQVNINSEMKELATNESHVFSYPRRKGSVSFKVALLEDGKWVFRLNSAQGILPNTRATIMMTDIDPTEETPNPMDINITNIFDFSKQPPPPGK